MNQILISFPVFSGSSQCFPVNKVIWKNLSVQIVPTEEKLTVNWEFVFQLGVWFQLYNTVWSNEKNYMFSHNYIINQ